MKVLRKTAAALTAFTMVASASAALLPETDIFSLSTAYADDAADYAYSVSISNETYDLSSLKTLAYYKTNELYKCSVPAEKVDNGSIDNNYVAEVKISIDKNIGFYLAQLMLECDEDLTFVGCSYYQKDGTKTVSNFDTIEDGPVSVSAYYNKVMILLKDKSNVTDTGEFLTLLFALPEKPEAGKAYSVALSQKTKILPWDDSVENTTVGKTAGSISIKDQPAASPTPATPSPSPSPTPVTSPTPASPTPTPASPTPTPASPTPTPASPTPTPASPTPTPSSPTPTPSSPTPASPTPTAASPTPATPTPASPTPSPTTATMPEFDTASFKTPVKLAEGASIDLDVPSEVISAGTKQVELKVNLSDFDAKDEYFDYAGLALKLPAGFELKEVKKSDKILSVTPMPVLYAAQIETRTNFKADSEYYIFSGIDSSKFGKDDELCTLVLSVPDNAKALNEVTVVTIYGRTKDDGKVALLDNGSEGKLYSETKANVIKGVKGDFNLDGEVTQTDATFMLRYLLESSMAEDGSGKADILYNLIKNNISESLASETKENIFTLAQSLADVDGSEGNKTFAQTDATFILRALLEVSMSPEDDKIDNAYWGKFFAE